MAEDVVEYVRLLQIVELLRGSDEVAGGKAAVGEVGEEHVVWHEAWHGDHLPACHGAKFFGEFEEVGDTCAVQIQRVEAVEEGVAGAAGQQGRLALVECQPGLVLFLCVARKTLIDCPSHPMT